jgi:RecA-family ATPase
MTPVPDQLEPGAEPFDHSPNPDGQEEQPRVLRPRSFADFAGSEPPAREWLVEGLVPMGCVTFISGDGGLGKTLLGQQLMMSAALGLPWLGRKTERAASVALFCEDDADEINRRARDIAGHLEVALDDPALRAARYLCELGEDNALTVPWGANPEGGCVRVTPIYEALLGWAGTRGVRLVLLDSLHDVFTGNENFRPEAKGFVRALTAMARAINGAVVVLAHPSVAGLDRGSGTSGSTAWNNAVRSRLYLTRVEPKKGQKPDGTLRILRTMKANYGRMGSAIRLKWRGGVFAVEEAAQQAEKKTVRWGPMSR